MENEDKAMKNDAYETLEHEGLKVKIYPDDSPQSPDDWGDNNAFLVHYHREFDVRRDKIVTENEIASWYRGEENERLREVEQIYHIFPVAAYIHSGVVLSIGSGRGFPDYQWYQWDVSHVGAYLCAKSEWPEREKAAAFAEGAIKIWNQYLSGDVWSYVIEDAEGEHLDSCGGFYGIEDVRVKGVSTAKWHIEERRKKKQAKVKAMVKNRVPLEARGEVLA